MKLSREESSLLLDVLYERWDEIRDSLDDRGKVTLYRIYDKLLDECEPPERMWRWKDLFSIFKIKL